MNKTRLNTIILVSLFILSLFLVSQTLLNEDINLFKSIDKSNKYNSRDLIASKMIVPQRILVNYSKKTHTVLSPGSEYDIWEDTREILDDIFSYQDKTVAEIKKEEFDGLNNKKSINIEFADKLPIELFTGTFGAPMDGTLERELMDSVKTIHLNLEDENFIVLSDGQKYVKVSNIEYKDNRLSKMLEEIKESKDFINYWPSDMSLGTKADIYIPYRLPKDKKDIIVENDIKISGSIEDDKNIDKIAQGFFDKDLSYLRKVVDNSGVIIYMYNQNTGLLVYPSGIIEYSNTLNEKENERDIYRSLNALADFIANKDRLPENAYISNIEEIESENKDKGYRFTLTYNIEGKNVYINNRTSEENTLINPLVAEVYGDKVINYKRFYRDIIVKENNNYGDKRINPEEVIEKNISRIKEDFMLEDANISNNVQTQLYQDIITSIKDISLGYYDKSSSYYKTPLIDVWIIDIKNNKYIFDSSTGDLIDIKSLE